MIDKDFINDSFIPEKPGQLLKEMKNDYVKGGLISEGIFNMVLCILKKGAETLSSTFSLLVTKLRLDK